MQTFNATTMKKAILILSFFFVVVVVVVVVFSLYVVANASRGFRLYMS
jgi:hypothetical protein